MTERDPSSKIAPAVSTELGRRVVLLGAGAIGAAGVLAACGGDDPGAGTDTASPEASPTTPTRSPAQPSATPSETSGGGTPLAATADVPVGGGLVVSAEQVVVTQPTAGEFKAFTSICTHQGCEVSRVESGVISCPCHGSRFSAADGSVARGPAAAPLAEVAVTVEGDQILLG
jgi:Rieske Fe-S protein